MSGYDNLLKYYHSFEEELLQDSPDASIIKPILARTRIWLLDALHEQERQLASLRSALSETRGALSSAQTRIEGMDRETQRTAAMVEEASRARQASEPRAHAALQAEQQHLSQRESEMTALRLKLESSERDMNALMERLTTQEAPPTADASAEPLERAKAQIEVLKAALLESEKRNEEAARQDGGTRPAGALSAVEEESLGSFIQANAALAEKLRETQAQNASLRERLEAIKAAKAEASGGADDAQARVAELEDELRERDHEFAALKKKLADTQVFYDGFLQRIQALEAERAQMKQRIEQSQIPEAPPPPAWERERAELTERLTVMQADLANTRRAHEFDEKKWIETMTHQDMERLKEIDLLKAEIERLKTAKATV